MFNKKLFKELKNEKILLVKLILIKVFQLLAHLALIFSIADLLEKLLSNESNIQNFIVKISLIIIANILLIKYESYLAYKISYRIKNSLRERLLRKVFSFKSEYASKLSIAELIHLGVEGIEQLNLFYSALLPQLIYSILGPIILFVIMAFINIKISLLMLLMIPLIPVAIMLVQKIAKKVVKDYWKSYTDLSASFIDFLYGLTTLQVFNADEDYNDILNEQAEDFRSKTMKLLFVQLNNITVLDLVSYLGSALGIFMSLYLYSKSEIGVFAAVSFILLSQEFFTPLRRLGALFHVAMNGISAANSLFEILEIEDLDTYTNKLEDKKIDVRLSGLDFSYGEKEVLKNINMEVKRSKITAIAGESGSGKSTIAKLIAGSIRPKSGQIFYNGTCQISQDFLNENIMLVDNNPYFFTASLRYNLTMANSRAKDDELLEALKKVGLYRHFEALQGLDTKIKDSASNLSGGQKQRLAIARAILKKPAILILDESISNIDPESEQIILDLIKKLKKDTTIIMITHRLNNVVDADYIYYLEDKKVVEEGAFTEIMQGKIFSKIYDYQRRLEMWGLDEESK